MIAALIAASTAKLAAAGTTAAAATTAEAAAAAAAAKAAAAATTATAGTTAATAGTTAALEAAKQTAIQTGIQNVGANAAKQAGVEVAKQAGTDAAQNVVREGIMSGAQKAGTDATTQAAQSIAEKGIEQGFNTVNPASPGTGPNINFEGTSAGTRNPGMDMYNQFTQAPPSIDPAAANSGIAPKPYVNAPPTPGMPGSPIDPNANLLKGVDYAEMPGVDFAHAGEQTATGLQKGFESALKFAKDNPLATTIGMQAVGTLLTPKPSSSGPPKKSYARRDMSGFQASEPSTIEYNPIFQPTPYAEGGIASYAVGGPVEQMSAQNAIGNNMMYPQSQLQTDTYSNPMVQRPIPTNVIQSGIDAPVGRYTGEQMYAKGGTTVSTDASKRYAQMMGIKSAEQQRADEEYLDAYAKREMGKSINTDTDVDTRTKDPLNASLTSLKKIGKRVGIKPVELPKSNTTDSNVFHAAANGGIMHSLGGYSDGGRLLRGPGDGVSDSIPATIGDRQPARLADGEFVVPARIVSELGNGSTEAGARKLYQMMERIQADRKKSIGKGKVAVNSKATKHLPK
jgi:hypothetical protein